ncbi:hypothetical protein AB0M47_27485 [Hamadaea sp. NPDC051192]|uniref:hypothetical protein n=1 Tax=Hamadaea sp. NPDC051192 TaxID=3154940 RepID=UPI00343D96C1
MTPPVLVTGVSGSGKSALTRALISRGRRAISLDAYPGLAHWADHTHTRVTRPANPDLRWLRDHRWIFNSQVLDQLITIETPGSRERPLILCGVAANLASLRDRFGIVIMLDIDPATQAARINNASRGNDFGRIGDSARWLADTYTTEREQLRAIADTVLDATGDLTSITDMIINLCGGHDAQR